MILLCLPLSPIVFKPSLNLFDLGMTLLDRYVLDHTDWALQATLTKRHIKLPQPGVDAGVFVQSWI